jgi:hypothetical protein
VNCGRIEQDPMRESNGSSLGRRIFIYRASVHS